MKIPEKLRDTLLDACRILDREGVMDELGHFSLRLPDNGGFLINGRVSPGRATARDLVVLDIEGNKLAGESEPALESCLHLAIFKDRPDVNAVAHTHSPYVVTLGIAGVPLRTVENQGASIIGQEAPIFEEYGLVDNFAMAHRLASTLGDHNICSLKSHGNVVVGPSIEEVCVWAIWAEKSAKLQYQAMLLGEPHWYPEEDGKKMAAQQLIGKGHVRTWEYYRWRLGQ